MNGNTFEGDDVDEMIAQWGIESPDIDATPMQVLARLHRLYLRYSNSISETFAKCGINSAAFDVLAALKRSGNPYSLSPSQLAQTSLVSTAGVTMRLDRLEKAGLVARTRDKEDRRQVHVQLTAKGLQVVEATSKLHFEREREMLAELSSEERASLTGLLRRLDESFDAFEQGRAEELKDAPGRSVNRVDTLT